MGAPSRVAQKMLDDLDSREALQDSLESFFDTRLCGPLKQGRFTWPEEVATPEARLPTESFVSLASCSVRALGFEPGPKDATVRMLFELDGVDHQGGRRSVRGEAAATLSRPRRDAWRLERLEPAWKQEVVRPEPRFVEQAESVGLVLPPEADGEAAGMQAAMNSGALAVRDFNADGRMDVLVADVRALYLLQATAPLRYERTQLKVSPPKGAWFSSLAAGDFDADGDPDVIVTTQTAWNADSRPLVLRNDKGVLTSVASKLPAANTHTSLTTDFNGDGKLDLVLIHYPMKSEPDDMLDAKDGRPPRFFLGKGDLSFEEVSPPKAERHRRWGLAAVAADLLGEGRPQVYVANDFGDNDLWRMEAEGTPRDVTDAHGLRDPGNGMSADVGDVNGDGRLDLYVANMFSKAGTRVLAAAAQVRPELKARLDKFAAGNTLYLAREGGGFEEVALARGVNRGLWAFGSIFLDADDDGRLDIAVANGFYSAPNRKDL
ncbi:FG-GAP repeat domain-containing protein [Hyalangium rubrum]|uniref:VCBS repeat-containing protein n=1 Tax=Hyalangium rubrum TaxID=3103134 RepID=A0ABU5H3N0_9BACT|nr:VCBS repeat-containing protein [Hyalangium sp. s54d21]MDY7226690.1 VCBS repeat-containing protein [Hyalangium sp. s54d21]